MIKEREVSLQCILSAFQASRFRFFLYCAEKVMEVCCAIDLGAHLQSKAKGLVNPSREAGVAVLGKLMCRRLGSAWAPEQTKGYK